MPSQSRTPLIRPVPGVYVRNVLQSCGGHFAVAWAEAEPLPAGAPDGFVFVAAVPPHGPRGERMPGELVAAFADGVRSAWSEGTATPPLEALVRLVDARWHGEDSTPRAFRSTGEMAALELSRCVAEDRPPRPVLYSRREPFLPWERGLIVRAG
ncbi:hypothetical protein [Nocardiopsis lambiniae]|uniref:Translation elongation factor EFG/EF2 domain-containing protein n=1 Tax=Nocardiopsis lambiniae TaxID=3075539 RepID=A0ABU2M552_9ACTN|nr:hypothetical protein [Nocardiopsis sp. DSM 44743]MDT0327718.1 hypothetical protein [Nocardiopsis sp. DSM 44743]